MEYNEQDQPSLSRYIYIYISLYAYGIMTYNLILRVNLVDKLFFLTRINILQFKGLL